MDVNLMQNSSQLNRIAMKNQNAFSAYAATKNATANSANVGDAYEVQISDAAKDAQAAKNTAATEETAKEIKTKGLDDDTIQAMQDSIKVSEETMISIMIQAMSDSNNKLQGWLDSGTGILNFGGTKIDAASFGLPEVATNAEDAKKAVGEGGEWSVDAVATRLFDLANAIAGDDPEKLQEMRSAIEEGFAQAGQVWQSTTGSSQMPDITQRTYNELMHRFDVHMQELAGAAAMTMTGA
jgi:hypothetical protein